ncbi:olfactory receptor 14J1-like, partial [Melospiza melodia melodia]|uniref:olfactory receptor 14J1-like n=1 Tax=Melospiza melodia melodia TaxID=1914991 RepID=UPI002FD54A7E
LHYGTLLGSRACAHMAAAAWASGFLYSLLHTANTFSLPLCHGNVLGQFFCEIPQILKLSCSNSYLRELGLIAVSACLLFVCFLFVIFSYVQIFRAVLRIPSEQGQHKAFSTCLPHLAVVSLLISTGTFSHLKPPSISSPSLDLVLSILYSVVPPAPPFPPPALRAMGAGWRPEGGAGIVWSEPGSCGRSLDPDCIARIVWAKFGSCGLLLDAVGRAWVVWAAPGSCRCHQDPEGSAQINQAAPRS